jgi:hypothetical protein
MDMQNSKGGKGGVRATWWSLVIADSVSHSILDDGCRSWRAHRRTTRLGEGFT